MDIINLYENLKKFIKEKDKYDDLFYDAPEGEAQMDIVKDMLMEIFNNL